MISNLSGFFRNKKYFSCSFLFFSLWFFIATWEKEKDVRKGDRGKRLAGFMCREDFCMRMRKLLAGSVRAARRQSLKTVRLMRGLHV